MNNEKIPSYPVVYVTIQLDGSAHVNVAGKHVDYPAADIDITRAQVITYAIDVAARLGRGVRMTTVDADGEWKLGVYPDGEVVDLAPPVKGRAPAKKSVQTTRPVARIAAPVPAPTAPPLPPTAPPPPPVAPLPPIVENTIIHAPRTPTPKPPRPQTPGTLVATLTFSTGDTAVIGPHAIIGRRPASTTSDPAGAQLVVLHDEERQVSRVHCEAGWVGDKLIVTDRASGNGTYIIRPGEAPLELEPDKPYELHDYDQLRVGHIVTATVSIAVIAAGGTR